MKETSAVSFRSIFLKKLLIPLAILSMSLGALLYTAKSKAGAPVLKPCDARSYAGREWASTGHYGDKKQGNCRETAMRFKDLACYGTLGVGENARPITSVNWYWGTKLHYVCHCVDSDTENARASSCDYYNGTPLPDPNPDPGRVPPGPRGPRKPLYRDVERIQGPESSDGGTSSTHQIFNVGQAEAALVGKSFVPVGLNSKCESSSLYPSVVSETDYSDGDLRQYEVLNKEVKLKECASTVAQVLSAKLNLIAFDILDGRVVAPYLGHQKEASEGLLLSITQELGKWNLLTRKLQLDLFAVLNGYLDEQEEQRIGKVASVKLEELRAASGISWWETRSCNNVVAATTHKMGMSSDPIWVVARPNLGKSDVTCRIEQFDNGYGYCELKGLDRESEYEITVAYGAARDSVKLSNWICQ